MKRKDLIIKRAVPIIMSVLIAIIVKGVIDKNYYERKIEAIKQENIMLPSEKVGSIMIYDKDEKCFKTYTGYLYVKKKIINNQDGIYINCDEAKITSKIFFDWESVEEEK